VSDVVYLDICCFKRPFDDGTQERVRREAAAVAAVLDATARGHFQLVRSPAHDFENARNPREDRRVATSLWLAAAAVRPAGTAATVERARALAALGFMPLDALHVAFAEASAARWFVTTDDRLLKRARRQQEHIRVQVIGPDHLPLPTEGADA
jgi:predicted nucleic acid-binding protein